MIKVKAEIKGSAAEKIRKALTGPQFDRFLQRMATDMGAQAKRNIIEFGGPGGSWAPLSGWNEGGRGRAQERIKRRKSFKLTAEQKRMQRDGMLNEDVLTIGRDEALAKRGNKHAGYAQAKASGRTPGDGKHGANERLRDTDSLYNGLYGEIVRTQTGARINLRSRGHLPGRPTNDELLVFLAIGTNKMPARNPAQNMEQFEKRFEAALRKLIGDSSG